VNSDYDVSTSFSTRRPPSPTLSPTIKQEVAFLAENIDAFDDPDEELSGQATCCPCKKNSPTPLAAFAAPRLSGSLACGFAASRSYAAIATVV
jgi:hypothetical protein